MLQFKKSGILLLLFLMSTGCPEGERHVPKDALRLSITLSKGQYAVGEPIQILTTFLNISSAPIDLNKEFWAWPDDCELTYEIRTHSVEKLEKVRAMIRRPPLSKDDFKWLGPGEKWEYPADFGAFIEGSVGPGTFIIVARYKNREIGDGLGVSPWVGEVSSNSVRLEIKQVS